MLIMSDNTLSPLAFAETMV